MTFGELPLDVNVSLGFVSGKQKSLFPAGPVIKCLMSHHLCYSHGPSSVKTRPQPQSPPVKIAVKQLKRNIRTFWKQKPATTPYSCHAVFTDRPIFSLKLSRIQILTGTSVTNCNHKQELMLTCRHDVDMFARGRIVLPLQRAHVDWN